MPSTSDELRRYWNGVDDNPAMQHLKERGFILEDDWTWTPPNEHYWDLKDLCAIVFLIEEWDFGGVRGGVNIVGGLDAKPS